jgi:outer membrane protein TolC
VNPARRADEQAEARPSAGFRAALHPGPWPPRGSSPRDSSGRRAGVVGSFERHSQGKSDDDPTRAPVEGTMIGKARGSSRRAAVLAGAQQHAAQARLTQQLRRDAPAFAPEAARVEAEEASPPSDSIPATVAKAISENRTWRRGRDIIGRSKPPSLSGKINYILNAPADKADLSRPGLTSASGKIQRVRQIRRSQPGRAADSRPGAIGPAPPGARSLARRGRDGWAGQGRRQALARRWSLARLAVAVSVLVLGAAGCAARPALRPEPEPEAAPVDPAVRPAVYQPDQVPISKPSPRPGAVPSARPLVPDSAHAHVAAPAALELAGPQPLDALIRRALVENRTVQAAYHNVEALRHRIPQVTALDDPVASNTVFPIPSVAPQYSLMGYNPYNLTLAQQFPWFGTLRLRGETAERDVQVALAELAAAQLDTVAAVKRAYYNLHASLKTDEILAETRTVLEDFRAIARARLAAGGAQQDVIRADVLISELDRERAGNQQAIAAARAALARQLHVRPDTEIRTRDESHAAGIPAEFDRLYQLAIAVRPELRGRLAAVARDEKAVELARQQFYPNLTLGLTYMDMEKTNAMTPKTAGGMPNVGLFVAFNLPVHRDKYQAGVCEAQHRALADAKLYEAQRDEAATEIQELMIQVRTQQNVLSLLGESILPRTRAAFELARSDYGKGNVDYATVQSALREVLQVELQVAQVEAELAKAFAALERAVGTEINQHPPAPNPEPTATTTTTPGSGSPPVAGPRHEAH